MNRYWYNKKKQTNKQTNACYIVCRFLSHRFVLAVARYNSNFAEVLLLKQQYSDAEQRLEQAIKHFRAAVSVAARTVDASFVSLTRSRSVGHAVWR